MTIIVNGGKILSKGMINPNSLIWCDLRKDDQIRESVSLFILYTAIAFAIIEMLEPDLCFKEKAKLFARVEIFVALLCIGAYIFVG